MGHIGYYRPGDWNAACDTCGLPWKASEMRLGTSSGGGAPVLRVCPRCRDVRNAQEFLRPVADPTAIPWSRPWPGPTLASTTTTTSMLSRLMDAAPMDATSMG